MSKSDIIRKMFAAYFSKDRGFIESVFADDFIFTSPYDDGIDKAAYFERCWPASQSTIQSNAIERIFVEGEEAFVTYKCVTTDGKEFRNTEFFTFDGDRIRAIDVYFGASYKDGAFVRQKS